MIFGGFRTMWLLVMFDLPMDNSKARKDYVKFRKTLLEDGFTNIQFSVMTRHCPSEENAAVHRKRVKAALPPDGEVRIITFTDKQFGRMEVYNGKLRELNDPVPEQLTIFENLEET